MKLKKFLREYPLLLLFALVMGGENMAARKRPRAAKSVMAKMAQLITTKKSR